MNEYDALIESCRACASGFNTNCDRCMFCRKDNLEKFCYERLHEAAADAIEKLSKERKTGKWCADYDGYSDGEPVYDMWWCSACGEYFDEWDDRPTWKYCPNCGAKMEGDNIDETI